MPRFRQWLVHALRGRRLLALDSALELLAVIHLVVVVADVIMGAASDNLDVHSRSIFIGIDMSFLVLFVIGFCVSGAVEGRRMLEASAVTLSIAHSLLFVAANLSVAVVLLATLLAPSPALVRTSRYLKLIGAYTRVWEQTSNLSTHVQRLHALVLQADQAILLWRDGQHIRLAPPTSKNGRHVFLSHSWRYAQDTAGTINGRLLSLGCGCRTFLDVNDLDNLKHLEAHVERSDIVLVILTESYIASANCRRELTAAYVSNKPIVVLVETEESRGATSATALRAELEVCESCGRLGKEERKAVMHLIRMVSLAELRDAPVPSVIEWYREIELKRVVYKVIIANVLRVQAKAAEGARRGNITTEVTRGVQREVWSLDELRFADQLPPQEHPHEPSTRLYLSPHYRHITCNVDPALPGGEQQQQQQQQQSVFEMLKAKFAAHSIEIVDTPAAARAVHLIFLCSAVFEHPDLVAELCFDEQGGRAEQRNTRNTRSSTYSTANTFTAIRFAGTLKSRMSKPQLQRTNTRRGLHGYSFSQKASSLPDARTGVVAMYSTEKRFAFFQNECPQHLKDSSFFENNFFNKFAQASALQAPILAKVACQVKKMHELAALAAPQGRHGSLATAAAGISLAIARLRVTSKALLDLMAAKSDASDPVTV